MMENKRAVNVRMIPANVQEQERWCNRILRVAPYCRVSTETEQQRTSYDIQVKAYTEMVNARDDWELVKVFADDGISGTSQKHRGDFQDMVKQALEGKIDMIITKSVSRFARNTVDALQTIRILREKGVDIYFEKENVHTLGQGGDFLITMLSGQAEAESYNISEAIKWGLRKKYKYGQARMSANLFGYTRDKKTDEIIIIEDEAETVRMIFQLYLSGYSAQSIANELTLQGRKKRNTDFKWTAGYCNVILTNEKYCGDWLTQKTYVPDFLTHKSIKNNGALDQYLYEGHHLGIISKEMFKQARLEYERRKARMTVGAKGCKTKGAYTSKYVLASLLRCKECGNPYSRVIWSHRNKVVWRCMNRIRHGKKYCHKSPSLEEKKLKQEILNALKGLVGNQNDFIDTITREYEELLYQMPDRKNIDSMKQEIERLKLETASEIMQGMNKNTPSEVLDAKIEELACRAKELENKIKQVGEKEVLEKVYANRRDELKEVMGQINTKVLEWNDDLIRSVVDRIDVVGDTELDIILKSEHVIHHIWTEKKK